jgi:site-specific DNA recombinase
MKTVNYLRVSTLAQDVERQQDQLNKWNAYKGNEVIFQFEEKESGTKDDRQELQALMDFVSNPANGVEQVVVDELSRLGRTEYVLNVIKRLNGLKINLYSVKETISTLNEDKTINANAALLTGIMSSLSSYELTTIQHRMRSGRKTAVKNGGHWGGSKLPFGYGKTNKHLFIDETEEVTVKLIFEDFAKGTSVMGIANKLNAEGKRSKLYFDWCEPVISRMLRNSIYIGNVKYLGEIYSNPQLQIISNDLWDKVQYQLKNSTRPANNKKYTYKLDQGKIRCGICGAIYTPKTRPNTSFYYCISNQQKHTCENGSIGVVKLTNAVESIITENFVHTLINDIDFSEFDKQITEINNSIDHINALIKKTEKEEANVLNMALSGRFGQKIIDDKLDTIVADRNKLQKNLDSNNSQLIELEKARMNQTNVIEFYKNARSNGIDTKILNSAVTSITVYPSEKQLSTRANGKTLKIRLQIFNFSLEFLICPFAEDYELVIQREAETVAGSVII